MPVAARELEAGLHRFRAAVAEERPRQTGEGGQPIGQCSLERMEGDLAALRAEVERLKETVVEGSAEAIARG